MAARAATVSGSTIPSNLSVDLPDPPQKIKHLVLRLMSTLQNPVVYSDRKVWDCLKQKLIYLLNQPDEDSLKDHGEFSILHEQLQTLLDASGKVDQITERLTVGMAAAAIARPPSQPAPVTQSSPPKPIIQPPSLPPIAFGKDKWAQYFGDVGVEPPLPPDIHKILAAPCPFFFGQTVKESHKLVLIPKTVNGKPFTLNLLGELVQHPKKGDATKYHNYDASAKALYGETSIASSYWVLMTEDFLMGITFKAPRDQLELFNIQRQRTELSYDMPYLLETGTCLFLEYFQMERKDFFSGPRTAPYTRCREILPGHGHGALAVGHSIDLKDMSFIYRGLNIYSFYPDSITAPCVMSPAGNEHHAVGIRAVRRFS